MRAMVPSRKGKLASLQWPTQTRGRMVPTDFWYFFLSPSHSLLSLVSCSLPLPPLWCLSDQQPYWIPCLEREKVKVLVAQSCPTLLWPSWTVVTRLLCPWDSPGKNTGVCCHFLLQGIFPNGIKLRIPALQADSLPAEPILFIFLYLFFPFVYLF